MLRPRWIHVLSAVLVGGCTGDVDRVEPLPLAVIDAATGRVGAEWEAPDRLFDVAVDPATGRVWGIAESSDFVYDGMPGPIVYELYADRPPREVYQLSVQSMDPNGRWAVTKSFWMDTGSIAIDATNRRAAFTSPSTWETVLLDLDSGAPVMRYFSGWIRHGNAFWPEGGIGYLTGGGYATAFRSSEGEMLGALCDPYDHQSSVVVSQPRDELYIILNGGLPDICIVDLTDFTWEVWPIPCNALGLCYPKGMAVHPDGKRVYIALQEWIDGYINTIGVFDAEARTWREVLDRAEPHGFAVSPDGRFLYVSEVSCHRVGVYDTDTLERVADIPLEGDTLGIDLSSDGVNLFVAQARRGSTLGGFLDDAYCPEWKPVP